MEHGSEGSPGIATVIKFFPLAILILDSNDKDSFETRYMTELHAFGSRSDDEIVVVEMWREPILHASWPERPMGNHLVLGGRTYTDSVATGSGDATKVAPGKRLEAVSWPEGDAANLLNGLHAFAEVVDPRDSGSP